MRNGQNGNVAVDPGTVPAEKDRMARNLAKIHFELEPGMAHIFRLYAAADVEAMPQEPVKLLEVNRDTPGTGVMPLHFGPVPSRGLTFPTVIIEVTPEEFEEIRSGGLHLPEGWLIGEELSAPATGEGN